MKSRMFHLLGFSMREDMRLEICGLGEFLVAAVKWTDVRSISSVNSDVSAVMKREI
jgi:hypothetical protein